MKDRFSKRASEYYRFRPNYPDGLFQRLFDRLESFNLALDCGTGNGQIATHLAKRFSAVYATDISQTQIDQAEQLPNVFYSVQPSEKTTFEDQSFDLITVGQAIHWFDFERFYQEVRRVMKPDGMLAVVGYGRIQLNEPIDQIIDHLYFNLLKGFWDPERKHIEEAYQTIPFPFKELNFPSMVNQYNWSADHLLGYLKTWSAVKGYEQRFQSNPVDLIEPDLRKKWGSATLRKVSFPIITRIGHL